MGAWINGRRETASPAAPHFLREDPWRPADAAQRYAYEPSWVSNAIDAAAAAQGAWQAIGLEARCEALRRYQTTLKHHEGALAAAICADIGKAHWDALSEAKAVAAKVDLAIGAAQRLTAPQALADGSGAYLYRPLGVVGVIAPFNFPVHLPNGQFVPALLEGNTVVVKASELAPRSAELLIKVIGEAKLPPGVLNVLLGPGDLGQALVDDPRVEGLFFTGSVAVGHQVLRRSVEVHPGRLVALELGGKNVSILREDCDLDATLDQLTFAAFATSGQRCTACALALVDSRLIDKVDAGLQKRLATLRFGDPTAADTFAGPLASKAATTRLTQALAHTQGTLDLRAGSLVSEGNLVRPMLFRGTELATEIAGFTDTELFGPTLTLLPFDDFEAAIARANATPFGLAAAVFTPEREVYEHAAARLRHGLVHWNRSTAGATGRLPFGGVKASGNHRPAGIFAGLQTVFAQSCFGTAAVPTVSAPGFR